MFITFEGIEGSGKSTLLQWLAGELDKLGIAAIITREPGGTAIGEEIRNLVLSHKNNAMNSITELLLMFAARAQHIEEVIRPALHAGKWVLCDRFIDSTYAYQGGGRAIPHDHIEALEKVVVGPLVPHLTLIFDVPAEIGLQRARHRGNFDRIEAQTLEFFERVRLAYHSHALRNPNRYEVIDASKPLLEVQNLVHNILQKRGLY